MNDDVWWIDPMFWTVLATVGLGLAIAAVFIGLWRLIDWIYDRRTR